jgi:uncharacterized protein YPO0396
VKKLGTKELAEAIREIDKEQAVWDKKYKTVFSALMIEKDAQKRRQLQSRLNTLTKELKNIRDQYIELLRGMDDNDNFPRS